MSGCEQALTDDNMFYIANLKYGPTFLDISWATKVTDLGLLYFKDKTLPIQHLNFNGLTGITSKGFDAVLKSCKDSII